jgi:hypothetical protein
MSKTSPSSIILIQIWGWFVGELSEKKQISANLVPLYTLYGLDLFLQAL